MKVTRFSIFRPPSKYKRFEYTPQFYDPEKEEREKRLKQLMSADDMEAIRKGEKPISFRHGSRRGVSYKGELLKSNLRLFLILGAILCLFYYLYLRVYDMDVASEIVK